MQAISLTAPINLMQIVGKKMAEAGKGGSVNIPSHVSMHALSGFLSYCVSKAGLDMATKMFALELGPHNAELPPLTQGIH